MAKSKREKTPPGWEDVVEKLKGNVDNPWAVVNAMIGKGYQRRDGSGRKREPMALLRRYQFESKAAEAVSVTTLGALARKAVQREALREATDSKHRRAMVRCFVPLREVMAPTDVAADDTPMTDVMLITEGKGNQLDRNFYPSGTLERDAKVFEGVRCFLDHPSRSEESDRPERSVRTECGWFSNVRPEQIDGKTALLARLHYMSTPTGTEARGVVESAIRYQKQFPDLDRVLAGLSIDAEGEHHDEEIDGEPWRNVDEITQAYSVDIVTVPARGGRFLAMREAEAVIESVRWRDRFDTTLRVEAA